VSSLKLIVFNVYRVRLIEFARAANPIAYIDRLLRACLLAKKYPHEPELTSAAVRDACVNAGESVCVSCVDVSRVGALHSRRHCRQRDRGKQHARVRRC
jgi:hypothetical protein